MTTYVELDRLIANRNILAEAARETKQGTPEYAQLEKELQKYARLISELESK